MLYFAKYSSGDGLRFLPLTVNNGAVMSCIQNFAWICVFTLDVYSEEKLLGNMVDYVQPFRNHLSAL